jgi:hypothetical protein
MAASGGNRYEGVALELLGRAAKDGLATIAVRLPDSSRAKAGSRIHVLGAVDVTMPAGRYLMVLIGDAAVRVTLPVRGASRIGTVTRVPDHRVRFVEAAGTAAFSPGATGLYAGSLDVGLPLGGDPLVMTHAAASFGPGAQLYDVAVCARRGSGPCPAAQDPAFGTGNTTSGGDAVQTEEYYDEFDGLSSRQRWFDRVDVRGSAPGTAIYAAVVVIDGGNSP